MSPSPPSSAFEPYLSLYPHTSRVVPITYSDGHAASSLVICFSAQTTSHPASVRFEDEHSSPSVSRPPHICLSSLLLPFHALALDTSSPMSPKGTPTSFRQPPTTFRRIWSTSIARCPSALCTTACRPARVSFIVSVDNHVNVRYHRVRSSYIIVDIISPSCCDMVISPTTTHPLHLIVLPATLVSPIPVLLHLDVVMLELGVLVLDHQNVLGLVVR